MTIRRPVAILAAPVILFLAASLSQSAAAAELQDCFREGYLCSIECDKSGRHSFGTAMCQAQCDAEEKVCLSKVAAELTPAKHSSNASPVKARLVSAVRQSYAR